LYEDEACLCILDSHPVCFGHSLLLPKAHFPSLEVTPPQIAAAMCAAVPLISTALMEATHSDSFNMLVNSGVAAGQVIFHTHFHIIPRSSGDGLWKSEVSSQLSYFSFSTMDFGNRTFLWPSINTKRLKSICMTCSLN
jgi:diadenosine tetraphosphate (Ap4A) HIT family hydrolase